MGPKLVEFHEEAAAELKAAVGGGVQAATPIARVRTGITGTVCARGSLGGRARLSLERNSDLKGSSCGITALQEGLAR